MEDNKEIKVDWSVGSAMKFGFGFGLGMFLWVILSFLVLVFIGVLFFSHATGTPAPSVGGLMGGTL